MPRMKAALLLSLATLCAPALAQDANPAQPGTINYIEGSATINGQPLNSHSVGTTTLAPGQSLQTGNGKAELLLTPGVFLRVGANSSVQMIAPNLTHTEVELNRGSADVEVDQVYKQNDLLVDEAHTQTQLLKTGIYAFNAGDGSLHVFDGKAAVFPKDGEPAGKPILVGGGHDFNLASDSGKPQHFNKATDEDELYNWSSLRSQYLGEANEHLAAGYGGAAFSSGWFWDPALVGYTWLPGDGFLYSPFGYGFYSPLYFGYGGYRGGYGYRGSYGVRGGSGFVGGSFAGRGLASSGGFHGGGGGGRR